MTTLLGNSSDLDAKARHEDVFFLDFLFLGNAPVLFAFPSSLYCVLVSRFPGFLLFAASHLPNCFPTSPVSLF